MAEFEKVEYTPGVCNIGREESLRRRNLGWISLILTIVLIVVLLFTKVKPWWRLFVFLPAMMSASGFLQAYFHFCSGFAKKGVFNFGSIGTTQKVTDESSRQKDQRRGNQITLYAVLIGLAAAIISVVLL